MDGESFDSKAYVLGVVVGLIVVLSWPDLFNLQPRQHLCAHCLATDIALRLDKIQSLKADGDAKEYESPANPLDLR